VPELLLCATSAALDLRDLHRAVERQTPEGVAVRSAPGFLALAGGEGEGLVRDQAVRRGAAVVVVVPGGQDLLAHALLTVHAARTAGLAVPAVVVAGPGGAGQREALREHASAEVHELPDPAAPSGRVADWPLAAWAAADPAEAPGAEEGGIPVLAAYGGWESRPVPDPRTAGRDKVDPVLLEVVAAEGPVLASRAFGLVNRAAGGMKLTAAARAPLSSSAYRLRHQGRLDIEDPDETDQGEEVLRLAGSAPVRVRALGPRGLDEVPLAEIADLMRRLRDLGCPDPGLPRAVLDTYGLVRMTGKAESYLARAQALLDQD
jgi:hypothetical protein